MSAAFPDGLAPLVADAPPPYDAVVFDCDSTLSAIEGVDELAARLAPAAADAVRALTERAMRGEVTLEEVYAERLAEIAPTRDDLVALVGAYADAVLLHAAALVRALLDLGKQVHVVSGGLLPAVLPFAVGLGVPAENVHAVDLSFDASGAYADFDRASPLARARGKVEVLAALRARTGARAVVLVGDGSTDLEAAGECARFVAFAGVVRRPGVVARALAVVEDADFAALVPWLLAPEEQERLGASPEHRPLLNAVPRPPA